jgi:hypothetical protein
VVMSMFSGAKQASLSDLIARKKYDKAIEILKVQFREGSRDPRLRMQLADVLVMAGRGQEAVPILISVADEFAMEGFAAKSIAVLKRLDRIAPGRLDVEKRLARLIKERTTAPDRRPELPELGMEEIGIEVAPITAPAERGGEAAARAREEEAFEDMEFGGEQVLDAIQEVLQEGLAPEGEGTDDGGVQPAVISPLFDTFTQDELLAVIQRLQLLTFNAGDIVITEGEAGSSLFVLTTGRVKAFIRNQEGHHVLVREMGEGEFFGEISILSGSPRTATVTCATRVEMLELDRAALDSITQTHPRVFQVLMDFYRQRAGSEAEKTVRGGGA